MKYQIGEVELDKVTRQTIVANKTRVFLLPCLRVYGERFITRLNNVYKVAVGLGDMVITNRYFKAPERHIFILLDSRVAKPHFVEFMEWIKYQECYEDDYVYGNITKSPYHMIVLKFPEKYWDCFDTFREGKYSEMFSQDCINSVFKETDDAVKIFAKDKSYRITFTERLLEEFNIKGKYAEDIRQGYLGEIDFPPKQDEETFK